MHTITHTSGESWILMAMQQCKAILHLGSGPEIISVGHNPYQNGKVFSNQTTLSTSRPHFLCEKLSDLETLNPEPMSLSAAIKELDRTCQSEASVVSRFSVPTEDFKMAGDAKRVVGLHHLKGLAPAQLQKVQSSVNLMLEKAGNAMLFDQASRHGDLSRHELSQHSVHSLADRSRHAAGVFGDLSLSRQGLRQSPADRSRQTTRGDQSPVTNANNYTPFRTEADATSHSNGHSGMPLSSVMLPFSCSSTKWQLAWHRLRPLPSTSRALRASCVWLPRPHPSVLPKSSNNGESISTILGRIPSKVSPVQTAMRRRSHAWTTTAMLNLLPAKGPGARAQLSASGNAQS